MERVSPRRLSGDVVCALAAGLVWLAAESHVCAANVALGRPYRVDKAPSHPDDQGPEAYSSGTWYHGELTDGMVGRPAYRAAEWAGWRARYKPIAFDIDLGKETVVGHVAMVVAGGGGAAVPPTRMDVWGKSPEFPYDTWVLMHQIEWTGNAVKQEDGNWLFGGDIPPVTVTHVRLAVHEPAWEYLFVGELRIESSEALPGLLNVLDVTIPAESCAGAGSLEVEEAEGGRAVPLRAAGDAIHVRLPLPRGRYVLRVRSMAEAQDTFSELLPEGGGVPMRPQAVTNSLFTWQRSCFAQAEDGDASIRVSLVEGRGVQVDALRIHRLSLNEPIKEIKAFGYDTRLVVHGRSNCVIAVDDSGAFFAHAERLSREILRRSGSAPLIVSGAAVTEVDLRLQHVIALGAGRNNFALLRARPGAYGSIPKPPQDGAPQVQIAVDVRGVGTNVVVLGGNDVVQVGASTDRFIELLEGSEDLYLPWVCEPAPRPDDRDTYRKWSVESGKWLRQGAIRTILKHWKYYGNNTFVMLGHRYIEYMDSPDTVPRASYHGALDMEFHKILPNFEWREHQRAFDPLEHLLFVNTMWRLNEMCRGLFLKWWGLKGLTGDEAITRAIASRPAQITWNHQTFPALCLRRGADYFGRHYGQGKADLWRYWVDTLMAPQLLCAKPMCDCWGYQDITMSHMAYYAAISGRYDYFRGRVPHQFALLRYIQHDNLGSPVRHGDSGGYRGSDGSASTDPMHGYVVATGGRFDNSRLDPTALFGVYVHPVEPMFYTWLGKDSKVPLSRTFDKITMRENDDSARAYLILDGISEGTHGHWDGNSILRLTARNRMWLCEGDYLKGALSDHNTVTIMRNAESTLPHVFSELRGRLLTDRWGATITRTADYNGLDWDRCILWHRVSDTFAVLDAFKARRAGTYDVTVRFRSLGDTELRERSWYVSQKDTSDTFVIHAPGAGVLRQGVDPEDAKNWKAYPFAEPTPKLFGHRVTRELDVTERLLAANVLEVRGQDEASPLSAYVSGGMSVVLRGGPDALLCVGPLSHGPVQVEADLVVFSEDRVLGVNACFVRLGKQSVGFGTPVSFELDCTTGSARVEASGRCLVDILDAGGGRGRVVVEPGTADVALFDADVSGSAASALSGFSPVAVDSGGGAQPVAGDDEGRGMSTVMESSFRSPVSCIAPVFGANDMACILAVGTQSGVVHLIDLSGTRRWSVDLGARVNALSLADLDNDGTPEVLCGVEDSHLYALDLDGTQRWRVFFEAYRAAGGTEGHVRVIHPADFDGDGSIDIAVGCANSRFYVLESDGAVKESYTGKWTVNVRHKASAIGAGDLNGDGLLELLCGYTYAGRLIVDFSKRGYHRLSSVGGCHGGCWSIAAADLDSDGHPEAVFADKDGRVSAAKPWVKARGKGVTLWSKVIGDDMISKVVSGDVSGDCTPELVIASKSGFLALLSADGQVNWVKYAEHEVTDAQLIHQQDGALIARSSLDGTVRCYDARGVEITRWEIGSPVRRLAIVERGEAPFVAAVAGSRVLGATLTGK